MSFLTLSKGTALRVKPKRGHGSDCEDEGEEESLHRFSSYFILARLRRPRQALRVIGWGALTIHDAALRASEWFGVPLDEVKTTGLSDEPEVSADKAPDGNAAKPARASASESTAPNPRLKFRLDKLDRAHPYFGEGGID
jgi:hypothetical protein